MSHLLQMPPAAGRESVREGDDMPEHSLPKRPDLDQLRRQAKELRDAVRAGDRGAIERVRAHADVGPRTVTLSAAQLAIAREYGFASWPRLKEELEERTSESPWPDRLLVEKAVTARDLEDRQPVLLDGRAVEVGPDPEAPGRVRVAIVSVLGPPPGDQPADQRQILLSCPAEATFRIARQVARGERLVGAGVEIGDHGLQFEGDVAAGQLKEGQVIATDGNVVSLGRGPDDGAQVRFGLCDSDWRELVVDCPADMELLSTVHRLGHQFRGLRFDADVVAANLESGQIVVLNGFVVERGPDRDDPARVRLVLVRALGPPPGDDPDRREIVLSCPADMRFETALPHNIDLVAPTPR
jgi:hypothetical protein